MKDGFLFVGNEQVLDFINTRPVMDGEPVELLPDFPALLRWFQAAGLLNAREAAELEKRWGGSSAARRALEAAKQLRERLRAEVIRWEQGAPIRRATIDELNRLLRKHPMLTWLDAGKPLSKEQWFDARKPEDLLAPLANSAAALFAGVDRNRVRKCERCVLHFHDTSKKGTRRWCSMQLCGNRVKVAAYAARHAAELRG